MLETVGAGSVGRAGEREGATRGEELLCSPAVSHPHSDTTGRKKRLYRL